jgi:hypothetical protein
LTLVGAAVARKYPRGYRCAADAVLLPPSNVNAFESFGPELVTTAQVLSIRVGSAATKHAVQAAGGQAGYSVAVVNRGNQEEPLYSGPEITDQLRQMQLEVGALQRALITATFTSAAIVPQFGNPKRAAGATILLGVLATIGLVITTRAVRRRRDERRAARDHLGAPATS